MRSIEATVSISDDGKILFTVPDQRPATPSNQSATAAGAAGAADTAPASAASVNITLTLGNWRVTYGRPFVYAKQGVRTITQNITSYQNNTKIIRSEGGEGSGIEGSVAGGMCTSPRLMAQWA